MGDEMMPERVRALLRAYDKAAEEVSVARTSDGAATRLHAGVALQVALQPLANRAPDLARAYLAEHERAETLLASVREHATQRDHATRHMMKARRERDEARAELDAVCAELDAVREALLTVREDGETCAAAVARLLEESESQLVALRRQGAEVEEARRERDAAVQRAERAERERDAAVQRAERAALLSATPGGGVVLVAGLDGVRRPWSVDWDAWGAAAAIYAAEAEDRVGDFGALVELCCADNTDALFYAVSEAGTVFSFCETDLARLCKVAWLAEIYLESEGGLGDEDARAQLCDALAALNAAEG